MVKQNTRDCPLLFFASRPTWIKKMRMKKKNLKTYHEKICIRVLFLIKANIDGKIYVTCSRFDTKKQIMRSEIMMGKLMREAIYKWRSSFAIDVLYPNATGSRRGRGNNRGYKRGRYESLIVHRHHNSIHIVKATKQDTSPVLTYSGSWQSWMSLTDKIL